MSVFQSVCKLIIFMYLLFAVYLGKFTVCVTFTVNRAVNLHMIYHRFYSKTMVVKKEANTAVNSKLPLAGGNPYIDVDVIYCLLKILVQLLSPITQTHRKAAY